MRIHVITPLHRVHLVPTLVHYLQPMNVEWYPIIAPSEFVHFKQEWIHPVYVRERLPNEGIAYKQNYFINTREIFDDDYYCHMMDDDMYEPGFIDELRKQTSDIVVISLYRGDTVPPEPTGYDNMRHPATIIRPTRPDMMRPGHIDIMQYIVKGKILKKHRFIVNDGYADGKYAHMLAETYPDDITFLPDWYGLFNYFQPGRYTTEAAFPKPGFKLPEIITK